VPFRPVFVGRRSIAAVPVTRRKEIVMRRITTLFIVAVATLLAAAATAARAAAPTHEWVTVDDTFTWDDCGFPVQEHDVATLHFVVWFDANGNRTRRLVTAPKAQITWTNALTGASVTSPNPFVSHRRFNADGSSTIAFTGLEFALPGGGRASVDSGREVIVFANGMVEPVSSVGPSDDLCAALTAAIG
jgi:hypothetical protein